MENRYLKQSFLLEDLQEMRERHANSLSKLIKERSELMERLEKVNEMLSITEKIILDVVMAEEFKKVKVLTNGKL